MQRSPVEILEVQDVSSPRRLVFHKENFGPALGRFAYKDCTLIQWYLPWLCTVLLCTDCQRIARSIRASPAVLWMWFRTVQLGQDKSKNAGLAQENCFGSHHNCKVCTCWSLLQQRCAPVQKSAINMTGLLLSVSDWSIIMIGPGSSLLVVLHLFAVPFSVLWVGLQKSK